MATIIFDFDGTIADTFGLIVDISYELTGAKRLPADEIAALRSLPILKAIRQLGGNPWHIPKLSLLTRPRMRKHMAQVPIFDGMPKAMSDLRAAGHTLYILSSNNVSNVSTFLQSHGLDAEIEGIYTVPYGNSWFKARALRKFLFAKKLKPAECYYVGNEVLDVHSAQRVGMKSVAVTWSGQSEHDLADAKPDFIINKPSELVDIAR